MSDLNYLKLSNVYGKLAVANVTTANQTIITNPANSNTLIRLNTILLCNISNTNNAFANVTLINSNNTRLVSRLQKVDNNTTAKVIKRDTALYMQEGDTLVIQANANNILNAVVSYEIIRSTSYRPTSNLVAIFGDSVSTYGGLSLPDGADPSNVSSYVAIQTSNIYSTIKNVFTNSNVVLVARGGMTTNEALGLVPTYVPGDNPFGSSNTIIQWMNDYLPEKVVLRYGLADAVLYPGLANSNVTLNNLQTIINHAKNLGSEVILLGVNPAAVDGTIGSCNIFIPSYTSNMELAANNTNNGIVNLATSQGLMYANPRTLYSNANAFPSCSFPDGIHPYLAMGANISTAIFNQLKYKFTYPPANTSVREGNIITFSVQTYNVPDGTSLWWAAISTTGTSNTDISSPTPIPWGNVTVVNNRANISLTIATDAISPETGESFYIDLFNSQTNRDNFTNVIASSNVVTIINV